MAHNLFSTVLIQNILSFYVDLLQHLSLNHIL